MFFARAPGNRVLEFVGNPLGVLDVLAIEIHHIKTTVRTRRGKHRMKPRIGRGEKLLARLSAFGDECCAFGQEAAALDEIVHRFADKKVTAILGRECVAAINRGAAGGREII